jgi:hypothetical protein
LFSKIRHILRKIGARTKGVLIEAMGQALGVISAQDVGGSSVTVDTTHLRRSYERRCQVGFVKVGWLWREPRQR